MVIDLRLLIILPLIGVGLDDDDILSRGDIVHIAVGLILLFDKGTFPFFALAVFKNEKSKSSNHNKMDILYNNDYKLSF